MAMVTTSVTELRPEGPAYRGRLATELALRESFERVADLLWQAGEGKWDPAPVGAIPVADIEDRMRWAIVMSGSLDPLRSDLRPTAVAQAARGIVATMIECLGDRPLSTAEPIAGRLASRLLTRPTPDQVEAIRAAMVLLADHELASSTLAVRIAASTRADVYDAVLAGLGTVNGPLHGLASRQAHLLLEDAERRGAPDALDDALRWQGLAPGFGHFVYGEGDPRCRAMLPFVERLAPHPRLEVVASVLDLATTRGLPPPNVDFALGSLSFVAGMEPEAGGVVFKIARVAGWAAHYMEELTETPLRYRARAVYVTPR